MIISRQLEEGMDLVRGKEILKIKELIRKGRSCTAVVTNSKGKTEKLTITDMWNQKVLIANPDKKIPEKAKEKKEPKKAKQEAPKEKLIVIATEVKRANGIATVYYTNRGQIYSSWKRTANA